MAASEEPTLPSEFGRYRIERILGRGAMGTVYLAQDTLLDRKVAIKTPRFQEHDRDDQVRRFYQEARSAALLRHPNLCAIYDVDEHAGVPYLSMAYIDGRPLSTYIVPGKPVPPRTAAALVRKLALALQHAHDQGILHRDLKPANIMLDRQREPIVMDFGLAGNLQAAADSRQTRPQTLVGTPAYMSPEQIRSDPTLGPAADIYSLGIVLYELITSRVPFDGPVVAIMGQALTQDPQRPSELCEAVEPDLESICLRMLRKKAEERYPSMQAVADALTHYLKSPPGKFAPRHATDSTAAAFDDLPPAPPVPGRKVKSPALPKAVLETPRTPSWSRRFVWLGAIAGLIVVAAVMWWAWPRPSGAIQVVFDDGVDPQAMALLLDDTDRLPSGASSSTKAGSHRVTIRHGERRLTSAPFEVSDGRRHVMAVALAQGEPVLRFDGRLLEAAPAEETASSGKMSVSASAATHSADTSVTSPMAATLPADTEGRVPSSPEEARRLQRSEAARLRAPVERKNSLGARLMLIPAGEFLMGSKPSDLPAIVLAARNDREPEWWLQGISSEMPQHRVRITRPFYLGKCEVSVGEFRAFVEATGYVTDAEKTPDGAIEAAGGIGWSSYEKTPRKEAQFNWRNPGFAQDDSHPVCMIGWDDAEAFCDWLSKKEGKTYRLPSEAEWEYACRAGATTEWPTGPTSASLEGFVNIHDQARLQEFESVENNHTRVMKTLARSWDDGFPSTSPGGSFRPNAFGLCDMAGNVKEWCRDLLIAKWYESSPQDDPVAQADVSATSYVQRIHRGGSFALTAGLCRCTTRWQDPRAPVWYDQGFRVVCDIETP